MVEARTEAPSPFNDQHSQATLPRIIEMILQIELQNNHVILSQQALKVVNGGVAATPGFLWHQVMHAHNQHVLVVGAIENAHDTSAWSDPMYTPEEVMVHFPRCRDFKRTHLASLRIDSGEDLVN